MSAPPFEVRLQVFTGPFDALLSLIARRELDVTEVALAAVTDDFISYIHTHERTWGLDTASEFLVIAATLLDLKAARLLPGTAGEVADDLEMLEARDLLFARLLQYRAFKDVAAAIGKAFTEQADRYPRIAPLEPQFAALLPELILTTTPEDLAHLAAQALAPRAEPTINLEHLHAPAVSVKEQGALIQERLRRAGWASFRDLVADASGAPVVVARFLALLELYRQQVVAFEQVAALGELTVRWVGAAAPVEVIDEYEAESAEISTASAQIEPEPGPQAEPETGPAELEQL